MRRLYLLRHAKASWGDPGQDDFDRPLDAQGERAAATMAVYCRQIGLAPGRAICSPARRTAMTWERIRSEIPAPADVTFPRAAYAADRAALLRLIGETPAEVRGLLVIGHNPGLSDLALWLTATAAAELEKFPTGALATLVIKSATWSGLTRGAAMLEDFRAQLV